MGVDMFLKIDRIQGQSTDASHADEIDIFSDTGGESQPEAASGGGTGRVTMQEFHFLCM